MFKNDKKVQFYLAFPLKGVVINIADKIDL